jgi:hypothetical protein
VFGLLLCAESCADRHVTRPNSKSLSRLQMPSPLSPLHKWSFRHRQQRSPNSQRRSAAVPKKLKSPLSSCPSVPWRQTPSAQPPLSPADCQQLAGWQCPISSSGHRSCQQVSFPLFWEGSVRAPAIRVRPKCPMTVLQSDKARGTQDVHQARSPAHRFRRDQGGLK